MAFQSGLTAVKQSEAIFRHLPAPCLGIQTLGNPDVKGTPREATPLAIMPIIFQSPADVDILCSGIIQFMATGKYEESERAKSGRHWNVHSFSLKSGRHHFVRVAQT